MVKNKARNPARTNVRPKLEAPPPGGRRGFRRPVRGRSRRGAGWIQWRSLWAPPTRRETQKKREKPRDQKQQQQSISNVAHIDAFFMTYYARLYQSPRPPPSSPFFPLLRQLTVSSPAGIILSMTFVVTSMIIIMMCSRLGFRDVFSVCSGSRAKKADPNVKNRKKKKHQ